MMRPLKFSFLFYTTALILGIVCQSYCNRIAMLVLACIACAVLVWTCRKTNQWAYHPLAFYITATLFYVLTFSLGFFSSHFYSEQKQRDNFSERIVDQQDYVIEYQVLEMQKTKRGLWRYLVNITYVDGKKSKGRATATLGEPLLRVGGTYLGIGSFLPFKTLENKGQFDYASYMKQQNIYKQLTVKTCVYQGETGGIRTWFRLGRINVQQYIDSRQELSEPTQSLLKALLLGDRQGMDEEVITSFQRLGIMHVLAISGLHIGIIYLFLSWITLFLKKKYRLMLILLCLWLFVFLSGFSASVFRAVFMFSLLALSKGLKRKQPTLEVVSIALFLTLLFEPSWLFDVGFQLSYTAVLGIVWLMPLFRKGYTQFAVVNYFLGLLYVSLVAQVCVLPLQLYYFNSFSLTFLASNLLVIPLITLLLILGLAFLCLSWTWDVVEHGLSLLLNETVALLFYFVSRMDKVSSSMFVEMPITKVLLGILVVVWIGMGFFLYKPSLKRIQIVSGLLLFCSVVWGYDKLFLNLKEEFIIVATRGKAPIFIRYQDKQLSLFLDSIQEESVLKGYRKYYNASSERIAKITYTYSLPGKDNLLVLSAAMPFYDLMVPFEVLYFQDNVKINYSRALEVNQPKMVVIGRNMSTWYKEKLIQSCRKKNIPFHDVRKKGYWSSQFL